MTVSPFAIAIITHLELAQRMKENAQLLTGKQRDFWTLSIAAHCSLAQAKKELSCLIARKPDAQHIVVFIDMFGGTPCNIMAQYLKNPDIHVVGGCNMPMIIQALSVRSALSAENPSSYAADDRMKEIVDKIIESGIHAIFDVGVNFRKMMEANTGKGKK